MNNFQRRRGSVDLDLERDYISNLPTNVKEVLMKLPIKEAVRTSLLSTKWKHAWMLIPNLEFIEEDFTESELIKLVDRVLFVHCGPVLQFKLVTRYACNEAIGRWMLFLSRNGIKNLYINLDSYKKSMYFKTCMIPSTFFSCLALEHVHISCSTIHVPGSFLGFKFLRTLRLFMCKLTGTVSTLSSSCPLLESLELSGFVESGRLVIRAPNLRWMRLIGEFGDLCLETPKLRFANINLNGILGYYLNFSLPRTDCKSNILRVLGSISAIEELNLGIDFFTYLAKGPTPEALPVPFYQLIELDIDLYSTYKEVAAAFCLFKSAPNLKVLSLALYKEKSYPPSSLAQSFWEVKGIESNLFNCLEIMKITYFANQESILNVAKFVLSSAPVLEKLVFAEYLMDYLVNGCEFLKKLASFRRLSKMAEIVFVDE